jgi:hypothetical protein
VHLRRGRGQHPRSYRVELTGIIDGVSDLRTGALFLLLLGLLGVIARLLYATTHREMKPPRLTAAFGIAAVGGLWVLANESVEGSTLVSLGRGRGITEADLPALILLVVAVVVAVWPRRTR